MCDLKLERISHENNSLEVLDLMRRAADYITLEVSREPDIAFVHDFFTAAPPGLTSADLTTLGLRKGSDLIGVLAAAKGYEFATDWWIGLVLIDPEFRRQGVGRSFVQHFTCFARKDGAKMLKLAVLTANPAGLRFWQNQGFEHHRDAPALPGSDGHDRVVLKYKIRKAK